MRRLWVAMTSSPNSQPPRIGIGQQRRAVRLLGGRCVIGGAEPNRDDLVQLVASTDRDVPRVVQVELSQDGRLGRIVEHQVQRLHAVPAKPLHIGEDLERIADTLCDADGDHRRVGQAGAEGLAPGRLR